MPTLKPEQLGQLMVDLMNANIRRITRLLIEWQLHTMVRPSEAAGAKWNEINWERCFGLFHQSHEKGLEHIVPLTPQALRILNKRKV
ncbi:tyrosine-type recombinase/integrase [Vibrio taketomensis]|uniref:tyrosine-type recombinase/integrase n=1 Tax=Vibrio taketomensis TaxID=2572923 RepID=UPI002F967EA0